MSIIVDAIEGVVDAVGDAIDWVVDEIIDPVVDTVKDVIDYALDNPLETILKVAAIATGQTWAIPLIDGAKVIAEGGDIEDAIKAAAVSYVAGKAGSVAGQYTSVALKEAGVSATVANIVGASTKSATTALVYGQDPLKAFAIGGLQAATAATLGWVDEQISERFGDSFEDLSGGVKDSIFAGVAAELEGGNVSAGQITKIIGKYTGVAGVMNDFLTNNAGFSDAQAAILTNAVSSAISKAITGNPDLAGEAFFGSISQAGAEALKEIIDQPVNTAIDRVSGAYQDTEARATALNNAVSLAGQAAEIYNNLQAGLAARLTRQNELQAEYDQALAAYNADPSEANSAAVNAAADAFNTYARDLEADYNANYKNQLENAENAFNYYNDQIPELEQAYNDALDWMVTETENLEAELLPNLTAADRAIALTLRPNFDEDAYREAAGLEASDDVYSHYLSQGQNLPTDRTAVDTALNSAQFQLVQNALANQGVDWATLEPEQLQAALNYAKNEVTSLTSITGLDFNNFAENALAAANEATPSGAAYAETYTRGEGVTDTDIANGSAVLYNNNGTLEWRNYADVQSDLNGTTINVEQNADGSLGALVDTALQNPDGTATSASGGITIRLPNASGGTTTTESATLQSIVQDGLEGVYRLPEFIVSEILDLSDDAAQLLDEYVGEPIAEATRNLYNEYVKGTTTENALLNTASVITGATGELLQAASGLALLVGANPNNAVGRLADRLLQTGESLRTEGYQAAVDEINNTIGEATGWREKARAIWDVATDMDTAGVFFAEYVGKEILQEIPILLASGGAGNVTKRLLQEAGEQAARRYASRVGVGTAVTLDMVEAFGGTAAGAYDEAYATALNVGMSEEDANQYAIQVGQKAGAIALAMVGVTAGVGGAAFEKAILGEGAAIDPILSSMYEAFKDRLLEGGTITIKEGVTEAIEEALPQAYIAMSLAQIDPTYDVSGEIMAAALLGKIAGAGTAGGIYTGDSIADALFSSSTQVRDAIQNADSPEAAEAALRNFGIDDTTILNNLLNTSYDDFYVSTGEAVEALKAANPQYDYTDAEAEAFVNDPQGVENLQERADAYVDERFLDVDEIKAIAAAQGVTLTDEEAETFVQQGDPTQIANAEQAISEAYDPQGVTFEEAKARFEELGFTATDEQINNFVGGLNEAETLDRIDAYVNPRQATAEEVQQLFADFGYDPTDEEVQQFVGQGNERFEGTVPGRIETYIDPRQVTEQEARQFFADLGYTPTDAELAEFTAQVEETTQQDLISQYVDPRQVTMEELQAIADEEGLTLTEALAATYIGQGEADTFQMEQLAAAREEYDPLAVTLEEATQFFAATGYEATPEEIAKFVASKTEEIQQSEIGAYVDPRQVTAEEAEEFLRGLGYEPTEEDIAQFTGQLNDDNFQSSQQSAIDAYVDLRYVDAGEVRAAYEELGLIDVLQEDVDRFVGQYMEEELAGRLEEYAPTATYNVLNSVLGSPAIPDDPNTEADESKDATGIFALVEDLEANGMQRDEALQNAIDSIAGDLGVTKDDLLAQLGTTEEQLTEQIGAVEEQLSGVEEQLGALESLTGSDLDFIANLIGKPAREVTQADYDFVADLVAQQQVIDELSQEYQQYDVTGDGILDINDAQLLERVLAGEQVDLSPESAFVQTPTGLYGQIADLDAALQEQLQEQQDLNSQLAQDIQQQLDAQQELNTQLNTELNTQLQTEIAAQTEQQNRRAFSDYLMRQDDLYGQRVDVRTPDPMRINYLYDFSSIFANPQQASLFPSPYAKGGQVEDTTDKLLRIIGGYS